MLMALAVLAGVVSYVWYSEKESVIFKVIFLDIGQGDSALIRFPTGEKMLVDCGPDRKVLTELGKVLPLYDRTIDYLLITHFDLDHYGGCIDVLERYHIKHLITNGMQKPHDAYWRVWDEMRVNERAVEQVQSKAHQEVIGGLVFDLLAPDRNLLDTKDLSSNNTSIVFRLFGPTDETYLFTGDIEAVVEEALLRKYCHSTTSKKTACPALHAKILKVGHHGSDTSSQEIFLAAVSPDIAVISSGKFNHFGHPSLRTLRHLERIGALILRTDELGAILMP